MAVPQVDKRMLDELEVMGLPTVCSIRAPHYSGNSNLESARYWLLEQETDPDIDQLPLVSREISIQCGDTSSEVRNNIQGMRAHAQERKPEERTATGRQRETSQVEGGFDADGDKGEDGKRILALYKSKRDEEERTRGRIRNQLQEDKAERRRRLGFPQENPGASVPIVTPTKIKPVEPVVTSEQLRDCLRTLKKNHKDDSARVTRAFQILLKIIANIVKNPGEEKFRRIRLSNPVFKDRVGNLQGGIEFLELCGFQKLRANGYLVTPGDKVDMALLNAAGVEIASAMANHYFGLLSK